MMRAAEKSAQETAKALGRTAPLVLGVTVLTSLDNAARWRKSVAKRSRHNRSNGWRSSR